MAHFEQPNLGEDKSRAERPEQAETTRRWLGLAELLVALNRFEPTGSLDADLDHIFDLYDDKRLISQLELVQQHLHREDDKVLKVLMLVEQSWESLADQDLKDPFNVYRSQALNPTLETAVDRVLRAHGHVLQSVREYDNHVFGSQEGR